MNKANGAPKPGGNLAYGAPLGAKAGYLRAVRNQAGPSQLLSFGLGVPQSSPNSLGNQRTLQFGDGTQDGEHHFPGRRGSIHLLGEGDEFNPQGRTP